MKRNAPLYAGAALIGSWASFAFRDVLLTSIAIVLLVIAWCALWVWSGQPDAEDAV